MLKKVRRLLQAFGKGRRVLAQSNANAWHQADLCEGLMWSLGLAMKLDLRVYIEVKVGKMEHGISVKGKDDPTLQYLYDLAREQWKVSVEEAGRPKTEPHKYDPTEGLRWEEGAGYV